MFYTITKHGSYNIMVVVDAELGTSRDVAISDARGITWTLLNDVLPNTTGYLNILRTPTFWITWSLSSSPPTITQVSYDNGETWTAGDSLAGERFFAMTYNPNNGLLVAVDGGNTGKGYTSTNGLNWTIGGASIDGPSDIANLHYASSLNKYVFLNGVNINQALNARAFTSTDGINWSIHTAFGKYVGFPDFCWAPELGIFCAPATARQPDFSYPKTTWTSTNGSVWTEHTAALPDLLDVRAICWSPRLGKFCVVAYGYNQLITDKALISSDGINWTNVTLPFEGRWVDVVWNGSIFCAIEGGFATPNNAATSPDGITWTARNLGQVQPWSDAATRSIT